jgi:acetyltransferase EpsM
MIGGAAMPCGSSTTEDLCLFGAGEHARVVAEAAALAGQPVSGCWAQEPGRDLPYLGTDDRLLAELERWRQARFHMALMGQPGSSTRRRLLERFLPQGWTWATIVHPTAFVSPSAHLGAGVFIGPRAIVHAGARLADHVVVNSAAVVEHDVVLALGAQLAPGAICGGGVQIGDWAFIGLGSLIRDHVAVGAAAIVGMGAVVVGPVAEQCMVYGNPARVRSP